MLNRIKAGQWN